jgi:peptidoglycan hydrolase-like protein with peptidoglycan-binding domain
MTSPQHRNLLMSVVGLIAAGCIVVAAITSGSSSTQSVSPSSVTESSEPATLDGDDAQLVQTGLQDIDETALEETEPCQMRPSPLGQGANGNSVKCLQEALVASGYLAGPITGTYDVRTAEAVKKLQVERELYVDGVAGRETGVSLGIWPEEPLNVIRTPPPAPGAVDLMGFPLSSVASAGPDAPPVPADSGSGRRLVYERLGQRVWAIDENEQIIRSWLVSGSKYGNETVGTHEVYSRSDVSTAWNGKAFLYKMVRWLKTDIGAIGFHALPVRVDDGSLYQTEEELGERLSGGCQRQANLDADFVWEFAQIGTPVVVL